MTNGVSSVTAGGTTTYTITASNLGPDNAFATVIDAWPGTLTGTWTCVGAGGGTCTASGSGNIADIVNLPVGGSVTYTVSATVSPTASGTISNTATVNSPVADPNPGNNSATDTDTVNAPSATTTTVTSSSNPSHFGEPVTFTATVASGSGTPTGTVIFKDGATILGTVALTGSAATFITSALDRGSHSMTASYSGAPGFWPARRLFSIRWSTSGWTA